MARLVKLRTSPPPPPQSALSVAVSSPPTPSIAYPPIYLSPSIDAFTPSPSPLPAVLSAHHHSLSQAAVVGAAVAGLVTVAVVATVLSTAAAKVGASCLFTPALQVLSSLGTKFGICRKWPRWNSKKDNSDHEDDVGPQGLRPLAGPNTLGKAGKGAAAAESLANILQVQEVVKGDVGPSIQTFISTRMSKFAASELEKHELMIEPLNEIGREAHYAQAFLSTNIGNFAASEFEKQGTIINELITAEQRISSPRAISKYAATELKKQEFLSKEVVTLDVDQMSRNAATPNYQPITSASLSTYDAITAVTPRPGLIETSVAEKNVQDKGGKKERDRDIKTMDDINGVGKLKANLVATSGGKANSLGGEATATAGPIVPMPAKTMKTTGWHATAADGPSSTPSTMEPVSLTRSRRPTNLGHVSLNCEMSIHRFRFFALCNSSGTLGSPPPSYLSAGNNNNNYNDYYYYNNYLGRRPVPRYNQELGNHNCALLENPQDLSSSDNTHYVQRSVQPIIQCITAAPATTPVQTCPPSTTHEVINTLWSSQHDSRPTIQEYGDPYYGA